MLELERRGFTWDARRIAEANGSTLEKITGDVRGSNVDSAARHAVWSFLHDEQKLSPFEIGKLFGVNTRSVWGYVAARGRAAGARSAYTKKLRAAGVEP